VEACSIARIEYTPNQLWNITPIANTQIPTKKLFSSIASSNVMSRAPSSHLGLTTIGFCIADYLEDLELKVPAYSQLLLFVLSTFKPETPPHVPASANGHRPACTPALSTPRVQQYASSASTRMIIFSQDASTPANSRPRSRPASVYCCRSHLLATQLPEEEMCPGLDVGNP
jgi:hypothetical protein